MKRLACWNKEEMDVFPLWVLIIFPFHWQVFSEVNPFSCFLTLKPPEDFYQQVWTSQGPKQAKTNAAGGQNAFFGLYTEAFLE